MGEKVIRNINGSNGIGMFENVWMGNKKYFGLV